MGGIFVYPCPVLCIKVTLMELYNQLANFFTGVRLKRCGQTQKHFSKLIPLAPQRISGLENGTIKPTLEDVVAYADYLDISTGDVFRATENADNPLHIYVRVGEGYHLQRRNRAVVRAFGMFDKLKPAEKRAVLKMLNGGEHDAT